MSAYIPAQLQGRAIVLDDAAVQVMLDATQAAEAAQRHADTVGAGTIAQQLLRSEAIASSQIEGIDVPSHRALAKAAAGRQHRPNAALALANIEAVTWLVGWAATVDEPFTVEVLREAHRRLAAADRHLSAHAGEIRVRQNWIGSDPYTPADADFVPPPAAEVPGLLKDLCSYANRGDIPPLLQAAAVHAQFETIHPFADGNGRVGRALIVAVLARRGVCREVIPPISLVLARERQAYVDALMAWRFDDDGERRWIVQLAMACEAAALASARLATRVGELQRSWRERAKARKDSAAALIIDRLPGQPILDAATAARITGRSEVAARQALNALADAGVLTQVTVGRRNRMWESVGLFALVDDMERELSGGLRGPVATR